MKRMTGANQHRQNPHHPKNQSSTSFFGTCGWILLTLLAVFCLYCIYRDLNGQRSDPIEIIQQFKSSIQNLTLAKIYNKSKTIGVQVADEMADSPTLQHFNQYSFTKIWHRYKNNICNFFTQNILPLFQDSPVPAEPRKWQSTISETRVIHTANEIKTVIVKEEKTCVLIGEEQEKCETVKTEEVLDVRPRFKIDNAKKDQTKPEISVEVPKSASNPSDMSEQVDSEEEELKEASPNKSEQKEL